MIAQEVRTARILLEHGIDYRYTNNYGQGVLHELAKYGTVEIIDMAAAFGMRGLDLAREDIRGQTPLSIFNLRNDVGPELRLSFETLLERVYESDIAA
jgi:hypothetical protein